MSKAVRLAGWALGVAAFGYFYAGPLVYGSLIGPDLRSELDCFAGRVGLHHWRACGCFLRVA